MQRKARLNILGAGRVGCALGAAWQETGAFVVGDVCNRTLASARRAVARIGAGRAVGSPARMRRADVWLIATPDHAIAEACTALVAAGRVGAGAIVFHPSGALPAAVLGAAAAGASVASAHPLYSFARPGIGARELAGCHFALEGDEVAVARLEEALAAIGARTMRIASGDKPLYHAGAVFACNYLVALFEVALRSFERAGVERARGSAGLLPLVRVALENLERCGPVDALTGPVERGDARLVAIELEALERVSATDAALYRLLGEVALELARRRGRLSLEALDAVARAFAGDRAEVSR